MNPDDDENTHAQGDLISGDMRYRAIANQSLAGIAETDLAGRFTHVNDRYCEITGYSREELLSGMRMQDITVAADLPENLEKFRLLVQDGTPFNIEKRYLNKDGAEVWVHNSVSAIFNNSSQIVGLLAVCVCITERKQAEKALSDLNATLKQRINEQTQALQVSEQTLHRAQSVAHIGSFVTGNDTETFGITQETAKLFGLDDNGQTTFAEWFSRVHTDDQGKVETAWRAALQGAPYDMTYRILVQGQIRWIRALAELEFDNHGQLTKAVGTVQDISDLKQIEQDLRESEERLEMALTGSGLVLWDWNIPERKVTAGNRWFDLLGFTKEELGNDEDDWMALINPKDLERFTQKLTSHLQGETASFESEHRLRHKDGHWVSIEARGKVTLRDQNNDPLRMVGTILDISQRKRLNKEGIDLLKQIESILHKSTSRSPFKAEEEEEEEDKAVASLTKRQRQILKMIATGMTSAEIGEHLHLSTATVISHRRNLMAKLNLHSTAEVTRFAIDCGLISSK